MNILEMTSLTRRFSSSAEIPWANAPKRAAVWKWLVIGILFLQMIGCVKIPEKNLVISHRSPLGTIKKPADCPTACPDGNNTNLLEQSQTTELNSDGFRMVNWNVYKGQKTGWAADFKKIIRKTDIIILQEAYLSSSLKEMLDHEAYHWDMAAAFEYRQIETGVLTASKTASNFSCGFRSTEPIIRTPKSVLVTRYPMSGTDRELLVANIHGINFTLDNEIFIKQADRMERILVAHPGPVIVSGDFNTWNSDRMAHVDVMAKRLGLIPVQFDHNRRTQFFGLSVDHIYYRGLEAQNATIPIVTTSDHNPLTVVFKLADESDIEI